MLLFYALPCPAYSPCKSREHMYVHAHVTYLTVCTPRVRCGSPADRAGKSTHRSSTRHRRRGDGYLRCRSTAAVSSAALTLPAAKAISRAARLTVSGAGGTGHSGHTGSAWLSWREPLAVGATRR